MDLYDRDIVIFASNILQSSGEIVLSDYNNSAEKERLNYLIDIYKSTLNEEIIEVLYPLIESEVIFDKVWNIDLNQMIYNILHFDLSSVLGNSYLYYVISQLQNNSYDDSIINMVLRILCIKRYKTKDKAKECFDEFVKLSSNIPNLDVSATCNQFEKFMSLFDE